METVMKYFAGAIAGAAGFFAPAGVLTVCAATFIMVNFITGMLAGRHRARRSGRRWAFDSRRAWRTVHKLWLVMAGIMLACIIDGLVIDFACLHLAGLYTGFVCGVEFWSYLENAAEISDGRLFGRLGRFMKRQVFERLGAAPDEIPDAPGGFPGASGKNPDAVGLLDTAAGFPDEMAKMPSISAGFPGSSGGSSDAAGSRGCGLCGRTAGAADALRGIRPALQESGGAECGRNQMAGAAGRYGAALGAGAGQRPEAPALSPLSADAADGRRAAARAAFLYSEDITAGEDGMQLLK